MNGFPVKALIDTAATNSHVNDSVAKRLHLEVTASTSNIGLALKGCSSKTLDTCEATVNLHERKYKNVCFTVLKDLLTDAVLWQGFMHRYESDNIRFGGTKVPLNPNALRMLKTPHPPQP